MNTALIDQTLIELNVRASRIRHIRSKIEIRPQRGTARNVCQHGSSTSEMPVSVQRELTDQERQVLQLICEEYSGKQIAAMLDVSPKTIASHRAAITTKLGAVNTAGIVRIAIRRNSDPPRLD